MENMPIFVKIDDYKDVLEVMDMLQGKLNQATEILARINEIKNEEDAELELWESELHDVEKRLKTIRESLASPEV